MAQAQHKSFASVLDMPAGDIERPKPIPVGSYVCVVQGYKIDKSTKKQTEYVEFSLKLLEAMDDVDTNALKEVGGIKDKTTRVTFYVTENSIYRLKEFLAHCGVEMEDDGSIRQYLDEARGKQVVAHMVHTPSDDGTAIYANVKNTTSVE